MQSIEQIPPETTKPETFTDQELASLALGQAHPVVETPAYSFARMLFWTVIIGGAIASGAFTLIAPAFVVGC